MTVRGHSGHSEILLDKEKNAAEGQVRSIYTADCLQPVVRVLESTNLPFTSNRFFTLEVLPVRISVTRTSNWNTVEISSFFQNQLELLLADLLLIPVHKLLFCSLSNSRDIPRWNNHWRAFSRAESKFFSGATIFFPHSRAKNNISIYRVLANINLKVPHRTNHRLRS